MKFKDFIINTLFKLPLLFITGGGLYCLIEILWRQHTHFSMAIVGGICFLLIGSLNEINNKKFYIEVEVLIGLAIVLAVEFISGCIINLWLGLNVWDYSDQPLNILGQICALYALYWIPVVLFAIYFDDLLRENLFDEKRENYNSFIVNLFKKK